MKGNEKFLLSETSAIITLEKPGGTIISANHRRSDLYGFCSEVVKGMHVSVLFPENDKEFFDPVKVVRCALENAASVASLMLTTETMIADAPKSDDGAGGGMPDMGGAPAPEADDTAKEPKQAKGKVVDAEVVED